MTDIMEARRKGFEEWAKSSGWENWRFKRRSHNTDNYADWGVNQLWISWNAALDSVCVELPEDRDHRTMHTDDDSRQEGYNEALSDCREALFYAGLKVKP